MGKTEYNQLKTSPWNSNTMGIYTLNTVLKLERLKLKIVLTIQIILYFLALLLLTGSSVDKTLIDSIICINLFY